MITVAELIEKLKAFPLDARVVTPGFDESGYDDIKEPYSERIVLNVRDGNHCGKHESWDIFRDRWQYKEVPATCDAVVIDF